MADRRPWSDVGRKEPERQGLTQAKPLKEKEWSFRDLGQRVSFGIICGAIMGASIGAVDVFQTSLNNQNLGGMRKLGEVGGRTMVTFAGFFSVYQGLKYVATLLRGVDDLVNVAIAAPPALAPMMVFRGSRLQVPYATVLVGMDAVSSYGLMATLGVGR